MLLTPGFINSMLVEGYEPASCRSPLSSRPWLLQRAQYPDTMKDKLGTQLTINPPIHPLALPQNSSRDLHPPSPRPSPAGAEPPLPRPVGRPPSRARSLRRRFHLTLRRRRSPPDGAVPRRQRVPQLGAVGRDGRLRGLRPRVRGQRRPGRLWAVVPNVCGRQGQDQQEDGRGQEDQWVSVSECGG